MINPDDQTIRAILDTAARFAERELRDGIFERDAYPYGPFAHAALRAAGEAGLLFITAPEEHGGIELPPAAWALVLEKIAETDAGFAACLLAHAMALQALLASGSGEALSRMLNSEKPPLLAYPVYLQEDDPQGMPRATAQGNGYAITGAAQMVANAPVADAAVIAAQIEDDGPGLFLVPLDPGLRPGPAEMLGLRSCPVGHLEFNELKIPGDGLLAREPKALAGLHGLFYCSAAAISISTLKASLDYALEYGRERYQGGRMIHEHSQLRTMYAGMATEHRVLREAWLRAMEHGAGRETLLCLKITAAELGVRGVIDGVQLLGGYGYTMEYPQERRMRDARQAAELLGSPARLRLSLIDSMIGEG